MTDAERAAHIATGSLLRVWSDPAFAALIAAPEILAMFAALGFPRPRFSNGYVLSKPPGSPPLFWHQDWWAWNEPLSVTPAIAQLGLIFYLGGAARANGGLRVLPGSHRAPAGVLARRAGSAPIAELRERRDPDAPEHQPAPGELDVPVAATDAAVIDARLFHAAHANQSEHARTAITLWYFPDYDALPESLRATIGTQAAPLDWPADAREQVAPLLPNYSGILPAREYLLQLPDAGSE
jgi:ectoine hydroxylase-related dioxygenase (phytanoyl-CoA dioxygenase family)